MKYSIFQNKPHDHHLNNWLNQHRKNRPITVTVIPFGQCKEWSYTNGVMMHNTGRFFRIIGCRFSGSLQFLDGIEQPMIDQPEIGILGFVVRKTEDGWEWLVQAKAEPGNIGGFQAAPSVQATKSNYEVVHKGLPTPLIECFTEPFAEEAEPVSDVQQSEQGDRFINKFNRNCVTVIPYDYPIPENGLYKWFSVSDLRSGLLTNFAINTDARSVLFSSNWQMLSEHGNSPFSKWEKFENFGQKLYKSLNTHLHLLDLDELTEKLKSAQASTEIDIDYLPLDKLKGWSFNDTILRSSQDRASFFVQFFSIHIKSREVEYWCQPLVESISPIRIAQITTVIDDVLYFFIRLSPEPGFKDKIQLGPSLVDDPHHFSVDWCKAAIDDEKSVIHAEVQQSDEGGRFMNSVVNYQIYEVDPKWMQETSNDGFWLTLAQLQKLASMKGYLTNEARSVLSIILSWI